MRRILINILGKTELCQIQEAETDSNVILFNHVLLVQYIHMFGASQMTHLQ